MTEINFRIQIEEDLNEYQQDFPNIHEMHKPEWAFNFWILDKLYSQDEDVIADRMIF